MDKTIGELFNDIFVGWGSFFVLMLRVVVLMLRVALFFLKIPIKIWYALGLNTLHIEILGVRIGGGR